MKIWWLTLLLLWCQALFAQVPSLTGTPNPNTGPITGGTSIILTGSGFLSTSQVYFGYYPGTVTGQSSIAITVTSPSVPSSGIYSTFVQNGSTQSNSVNFNYTSGSPTPTNTSTNTPTNTPTITNTPTNTPIITNTPTWTWTYTPTYTNTITNTPTYTLTTTNTPTSTYTNTPTYTATSTPTNTYTPIPAPTYYPVVNPDPSSTPTPLLVLAIASGTVTPSATPNATQVAAMVATVIAQDNLMLTPFPTSQVQTIPLATPLAYIVDSVGNTISSSGGLLNTRGYIVGTLPSYAAAQTMNSWISDAAGNTLSSTGHALWVNLQDAISMATNVTIGQGITVNASTITGALPAGANALGGVSVLAPVTLASTTSVSISNVGVSVLAPVTVAFIQTPEPFYNGVANAATSATGYAVSIIGSYLFNKASLAVTSIGGTGAVTFAVYESQNPTYSAWVSMAGVSITGSAATTQLIIPTPAIAYAVSVLGTAAATTVRYNLLGTQ